MAHFDRPISELSNAEIIDLAKQVKEGARVAASYFDPSTDPVKLKLWEAARERLKKQHRCQCFLCVAQELAKG